MFSRVCVCIALAGVLHACQDEWGVAGEDRASNEVSENGSGLTGKWQIESEDGEPGGPFLILRFNSATAAAISGEVLGLMVGNAGLGPTAFKPFTAEPARDATLRFVIETSSPTSPPIILSLIPESNNLRIVEFMLAGDDMLGNNRRWRARRLQ